MQILASYKLIDWFVTRKCCTSLPDIYHGYKRVILLWPILSSQCGDFLSTVGEHSSRCILPNPLVLGKVPSMRQLQHQIWTKLSLNVLMCMLVNFYAMDVYKYLWYQCKISMYRYMHVSMQVCIKRWMYLRFDKNGISSQTITCWKRCWHIQTLLKGSEPNLKE